MVIIWPYDVIQLTFYGDQAEVRWIKVKFRNWYILAKDTFLVRNFPQNSKYVINFCLQCLEFPKNASNHDVILFLQYSDIKTPKLNISFDIWYVFGLPSCLTYVPFYVVSLNFWFYYQFLKNGTSSTKIQKKKIPNNSLVESSAYVFWCLLFAICFQTRF